MTMQSQLSRSAVAGSVIVASVMCATPSLAVTARDVMQKMSKQERFSYLTGLIDMQMFQAGQSGQAAVSRCIHDAYYDRADADGAWSKLYDAFDQFPDKEATAIVYLLGKKTCGG